MKTKTWADIPFFSEEYRDYGTLTRYDVDIILRDHAFVERCKKDGILTYERLCNELKAKIKEKKMELEKLVLGVKINEMDEVDRERFAVLRFIEKLEEKKNELV